MMIGKPTEAIFHHRAIIPHGNLAAYYPETNPLVPLSSYGDETHTPTSKSIPVAITRSPFDTQAPRRIA